MPQTYDVLATSLTKTLPSSLDFLQRLVSINSFTANGHGVDRVGDLVEAEFAALGFTAERIRSVNPACGKHLVLTRRGTKGALLGLVAHLDTVYPQDDELRNRFSWRTVGNRVYGPGVWDDKAGIAMIHLMLSAMRDVLPDAFESVSWEILLDASEETLADDFRDLCVRRLAGTARACLVFEPGNVSSGLWTLAVSRKGMAEFRVLVEGHSAHAGSNHREGANAIVQAGEIARQLASMTDYASGLTVNPGTISGGTVTNRVPHEAEICGELRAFAPEVFAAAVEQVRSMTGDGSIRSADGSHRCRVSVDITHQTAPWPRNPASEELLAVWMHAAEELGMRLAGEERGGLSDGNGTWRHVPTIDGLGPLGGNAHCSEYGSDGSSQEFVDVSTFVPKALLNAVAISRLPAGA